MSIIDVLAVLVPVSFGALLLAEVFWPARSLPPAPGFRWIGWGGLFIMGATSTFLPLLVPEAWVERYRVFDLSALGTSLGFFVGWVVYTLLGYLWHRAAHASPLLWRGFHQLHHAPARLDVASSTIFHPSEIVAYTMITWLCTVLLLGLTPEAAALLGFFAAFVSFFQHANIRTPLLLGYFIQRPEAHSLHHHVDGPRGNFSDLPLWDIVFGTFCNPATFTDQVGFSSERRRRWGAMLAFVDVHAAPRASQAFDRVLEETSPLVSAALAAPELGLPPVTPETGATGTEHRC